jgi:Tfp pilus assembly protein PilV
MELSKGFSLLEVLLSLMLIMTIALGLLDQRTKIKSVINQTQLYSRASNILDQTEELLNAHIFDIKTPEQPFELTVRKAHDQLDLNVQWFKGEHLISRSHRFLGKSK